MINLLKIFFLFNVGKKPHCIRKLNDSQIQTFWGILQTGHNLPKACFTFCLSLKTIFDISRSIELSLVIFAMMDWMGHTQNYHCNGSGWPHF